MLKYQHLFHNSVCVCLSLFATLGQILPITLSILTSFPSRVIPSLTLSIAPLKSLSLSLHLSFCLCEMTIFLFLFLCVDLLVFQEHARHSWDLLALIHLFFLLPPLHLLLYTCRIHRSTSYVCSSSLQQAHTPTYTAHMHTRGIQQMFIPTLDSAVNWT